MNTKSKVLSPFPDPVNFWTLSVVSIIDSALQISFSISRIDVLLIRLLRLLVTALSVPYSTSVLMN